MKIHLRELTTVGLALVTSIANEEKKFLTRLAPSIRQISMF